MKRLKESLYLCLFCLLSATLFSCGEEMLGGVRYKPGAVEMEVNGEIQAIDKMEIEIPADSDYVTITFIADKKHITEYSIEVVKSNSMELDFINPWTPDLKPYKKYGDEFNPHYVELYYHQIRVTALDKSSSDIKFKINAGHPPLVYVSEFTVVKKGK